MIRLLLVDDHTAFRGALAFMLGREEDIEIAGEAGNLDEARSILQSTPVDVALVDLDLSGEQGTDLVSSMRSRHPQAVAVVLTGNPRPESRASAVATGAVGVLHKSTSIPSIVAAVRTAAAGQPLISPAEAVELLREAVANQARTDEGRRALESLTDRERDVLRALATGLDNQAIADRLHISHETVRSHIVRILRKLGVESRLQAVLFALRYGFLDPHDIG
ncbi:MAG TPA: response regulator transcription factor [Thermomicrobiales bacterium]|nr:response regulator transcription factor [Thermomicrobiales bacterium]